MSAKSSPWLVEVVTSWGDSVLSVRHLRAGERFVIGEDIAHVGSEIPANLKTWAITGVALDGRCWIELPPHARFAVERADSRTAEGEFDRADDRGEAFELEEGLRVRCQIGTRTLAMRMVKAEPAKLGRAKDSAWRLAFAAAAVAVGSLLVGFESAHRVYEDERLAHPLEQREELLHAMIQRAVERESADARELVRKEPKRLSRFVAFSCMCGSSHQRVYAYGIPPGMLLSPFGSPRENLQPYGIYALVMRGDEIAVGGLSPSQFEDFPPTGWLDLVDLDWNLHSPWGTGVAPTYNAQTHRPAVRVIIEDRAHDGPSDERVRAAERLVPTLRRCYTHALRTNGARTGRVVLALDYDHDRSIQSVMITRDTVGDRTLDACVTRAAHNQLSRAENADGRERLIMDFELDDLRVSTWSSGVQD